MFNNKKIVIIGAGGHAVSVANVAISAGYKIAYFVDINKREKDLLGVEIIEDISQLKNPSVFYYNIGVGDNALRSRLYEGVKITNPNLNFPSLIHKSSVISYLAKVGKGSVIMPNAIVGPNSCVGEFCILNNNSSLDHDSRMFDFSSLAPSSATGGRVTIGYRSGVSIGSVVKQGIRIDNDTILGANSYLDENLPNNCIAYGSPAKVIRQRQMGDPYLI